MNNKIFKSHLREFYPLITKLVCSEQVFQSFIERNMTLLCTEALVYCNLYIYISIFISDSKIFSFQMDVRGALADVFSKQITILLPKIPEAVY